MPALEFPELIAAVAVPVTYDSSFIPSGDVVITGQENGVIRLTVPGVLKQSQNKSTTTYRLVVEVRMSGDPIKIGHLEPIVRLGGAAPKTP